MAEPERFLLAWLDESVEITRTALTPIRRKIEDTVKTPRDRVEIDIWLESPGGDAHAAYKLALLLRAAASKVRVVVPDYAKSAATLLSLVGDEIYLAPAADFGPLDAQMPDEGTLSGSISALNIARAADEVARDAVEMAVTGGADLLAITGLSRAQTLDAMLRFSASFSEPLVCQLDPKVVHHAKQMLQVTAKYAEHLLKGAGNESPRRIAQALVETFPTHGYVISREEAKELGLPVFPIEDYEFAAEVRKIHRVAEDGMHMIEFWPFEAVVKAGKRAKTAKSRGARAAKATPAKGRASAKGGETNGRATNEVGRQQRNGVAAGRTRADG
jgi:hypothetical protein